MARASEPPPGHSERLAFVVALSTTGTRTYQALGRVIASDFPFADLEAAADGAGPLVTVLAASDGGLPARGELVRELPDDDGVAQLRVYENALGITWTIRNVGTVWANGAGDTIRYLLDASAALREAEHYLVGPVLAVAAQMRGELILHAGAVMHQGRAIAFTGPPGFGKSTLTASFGRLGLPMFGDDTLPIQFAADGQPLAVPYMPKMKLWDETIHALSGESAEEHERILDRYPKRRVRAGGAWGDLASGAAPLSVVYFLNPSPDAETQFTIDAFDAVTATLILQSAMYQGDLLRGRRAALALEATTRLVPWIAVRRVTYFRSFDNLPRLRERLLLDAETAA